MFWDVFGMENLLLEDDQETEGVITNPHLKNAEKWKIIVVLTSVNGFAFRFEILYLCITEVEIAHEIRVISTFFIPKNPFFGSKNKLPCFFKVKQPVFNVTYSGTANRYCCEGE